MNKLTKDIAMRAIKLLNIILVTIPFAVCWYHYYADRLALSYYRRGHWVIIAVFFIFYAVFGKVYDAFQISINKKSEMAFSQALAEFFTNFILYVIIILLSRQVRNPLPLFASFAIEILFSIVWSYIAQWWYFRTFPARKSAVIYDDREGLDKIISDYEMDRKFEVIIAEPVEACLNDIGLLDGIEVVFLSGIHSHDRNIILKYCIANDIRVYVIPRIGDVLMSSAKRCHMLHLPILQVERYNPSPEYLFCKRGFDIIVSALMLLFTSPIFLITAIAIKREDGGDVFYKQCRLTKDGRQFDIYKFRSMRMDAEKDGVARLSTGEDDDRITKVGRFIRKCRIDELPQLINILKGSLSICGPRPERPEIAAQYEEEIPEFNLRLQAKAGLTGFAQVYGKYNTSPYDKLQMDLMYIAHPSFVEDLKIMFATVKILFMPESTEGVAEGQVTAAGTQLSADVIVPVDSSESRE